MRQAAILASFVSTPVHLYEAISKLDAYQSTHRRSEQLRISSTNLLSTVSTNPRSQVGWTHDDSDGTLRARCLRERELLSTRRRAADQVPLGPLLLNWGLSAHEMQLWLPLSTWQLYGQIIAASHLVDRPRFLPAWCYASLEAFSTRSQWKCSKKWPSGETIKEGTHLLPVWDA